jgi:hypothetical protein
MEAPPPPLSPPLGQRARAVLVVLGTALILAALGLGYMLFINVVVGLTEPGHLSGVDKAFVTAELLFDPLLLLTGAAALAATHRWGLRVLAALALLTAADFGFALVLYPRIVAEECASARAYAAQTGENEAAACAS